MHDMPSASGWEPLLQKYEAMNYATIPQLWEDYLTALQSLLRSAIRCGSSAVWFFDGATDDLRALAQLLPSMVDEASPYHRNFPYPLSEPELLAQGMAPVRTSLGISEDNNEHILYMCSKRAFREREPVLISAMSDQVREAFQGYEELIGVRSGFTQAFDRLIVRPSANVLELHIDLCCPLNVEELVQYYVTYVDRLKSAVVAAGGVPLLWLREARDLFPRIAHLYNAPDGQVLGLGHATGTKSIKEERMRDRTLDLREELFHKHGILAINGTDAYSIKKGWLGSAVSNVPSVSINGHFSRAGSTHGAVHHAIIEGCVSPHDLDLVRSKIL
jgi:hypothetical protein